MPFEFHHRSATRPRRIALFPGAWNPPTTAHLAIANAALAHADEIVWVLPRELPHKSFHGASFEERLQLLQQVASESNAFSVATAQGGLYVDIAEQARGALPDTTEILLVCGRDAADRIATWNYGREGVFDEMIAAFTLLVAARAGEYSVHERHRDRIVPLQMKREFNHVSSSEVRTRIASGEPWQHLVPSAIHDAVSKLYR